MAVHAAVRVALGTIGQGLYGVACSGGADSVALADATIEVAGAPHVVVLVIDHGLVDGSARVAGEVAAWARSRGAAAVVRRVEVASRASLEAAARDARYAALEELADELGLVAILLGHTARDQAETVLMRILRGTGPAGLAGIPARRGRFVRPLLALDRAVIDAHVAQRRLPVHHDPMNDDSSLTRVRIRNEVLPALRRENPQLDAALLRLAASAAEWLAAIDERAARFAQLPIDCATLAREPAAIRKRAIMLALGSGSATHLEAIDDLITSGSRGERSLDLPGLRLVRSYDQLAIANPVQNVAIVPPAGYALRIWQPGDRMRPARLQGRSRKLSDLFIDAKIPRHLRATARVVIRISDQTIVWAEFLGIALVSDDEAAIIGANLPG